ncbi:MAG: GntR family transcriptional regulator [Gemmatimonadetes bacterium]|nr:GntR family transcriptional regulator [Gemmatimonadota bacterium]
MGYSFTDRVRKVLSLARTEAVQLGHDYVGTEHLLLGLVDEGAGLAASLLAEVHGGHGAVRARVADCVRRGKAVTTAAELPYTSRAKKVLEFAMAEARELGHAHVGTEHLLLGLLREEKGIAAQVLTSLRMTLDGTRTAVLQILSGKRVAAGVDATRATPVDPVWFVEIDEQDATPIYEQIIARIEEAVATGRLIAGERLPSVRDLASELGVAPGTVARAYTALEKRGVLVTEGARGTRVADAAPAPKPEDLTAVLEGLLRPVAVAAYHMGATAKQVVDALERVIRETLTRTGNGGGG